MAIIRGTRPRPVNTVAFGGPGTCKSTTFAKLPNTLFLDCEGNGADFVGVDRIPVESWTEMDAALQEVVNNHQYYKNLVVDPGGWAEAHLAKQTCIDMGITSLTSVAYGKATGIFKQRWAAWLDMLRAIGKEYWMNVTIICHTGEKKVEEIGEEDSGAFTVYSAKLNKENADLIQEWADQVLCFRLDRKVGKGQGGKTLVGGTMAPLIMTNPHPNWVAKNRFQLPGTIRVGKLSDPFPPELLRVFELNPKVCEDRPEETEEGESQGAWNGYEQEGHTGECDQTESDAGEQSEDSSHQEHGDYGTQDEQAAESLEQAENPSGPEWDQSPSLPTDEQEPSEMDPETDQEPSQPSTPETKPEPAPEPPEAPPAPIEVIDEKLLEFVGTLEEPEAFYRACRASKWMPPEGSIPDMSEEMRRRIVRNTQGFLAFIGEFTRNEKAAAKEDAKAAAKKEKAKATRAAKKAA